MPQIHDIAFRYAQEVNTIRNKVGQNIVPNTYLNPDHGPSQKVKIDPIQDIEAAWADYERRTKR